MEQRTSDLFELQVDPQSQNYLGDVIRWAKFLAIFGFIAIFLILASGMYQLYTLSRFMDTFSDAYTSGYTIGIMVVYVVLAALAFFPSLFLLRFSLRMQAALRNNDQESLVESFRHLRSCYRFLGILAILFICFWIFTFVMRLL